jgi:hypothetical protein
MNDCRICGRKIRYRVVKISVNGKRGVGAWLETEDQPPCPCLNDCVVDKLRSDKSRPSKCDLLIKRWNDENPTP